MSDNKCNSCNGTPSFLTVPSNAHVKIPSGTCITPVNVVTEIPAVHNSCNPCNSEKATHHVPQPFYAGCAYETAKHCSDEVKVQHGVKIIKEFTVPACNTSADMYVDSFEYFPVGAYIYHPLASYLKVVEAKPCQNILVVRNECNPFSDTVGQVIPTSTIFTITHNIPTTGSGTQLQGYYLGQNFIVPASGDCENVYIVPSTSGLQVNDDIQFASGTYTVSAVTSSNVIRICNNGFGGVAGTNVIALDTNQEYQYPVVVIEQNPCNNTTVTKGKVIVCDSGKMKPVTGPVGSLLTFNDDGTVEGKNYVLPVVNCRSLTACLILTTTGNVIATIANTAGLIVGQRLELTYGNVVYQLEIVTVLDGTHLELDLLNPPGVVLNIAPGNQLCDPSCCTILTERLDDLEDSLTCFPSLYLHTNWSKVPICRSPLTATFAASSRYASHYEVLNETEIVVNNNTGCDLYTEVEYKIQGLHSNVVSAIADEKLRVKYGFNLRAAHIPSVNQHAVTSGWMHYGDPSYSVTFNETGTPYPSPLEFDFNTAGQPYGVTWGGALLNDCLYHTAGGVANFKLSMAAIYDRLDSSTAAAVTLQDFMCTEVWYRTKSWKV
jgi:hypothetical protein